MKHSIRNFFKIFLKYTIYRNLTHGLKAVPNKDALSFNEFSPKELKIDISYSITLGLFGVFDESY